LRKVDTFAVPDLNQITKKAGKLASYSPAPIQRIWVGSTKDPTRFYHRKSESASFKKPPGELPVSGFLGRDKRKDV